jgi:hypothetical protein
MRRLLDILPATMEQADQAADKFCGITPLCEPAELKRARDEGFLESAIVLWNGVPQYCVWLATSLDNGLHINAAVQLVDKPVGFGSLVAMVESLAEKRGAKYVRFNTARDGLIRKAAQYGYNPQSVCLIKNF